MDTPVLPPPAASPLPARQGIDRSRGRSSRPGEEGRAGEARQSRITARLNAQGAMLEELRGVLPVLRPEAAREDARRAILEENALRRPSLGSRVDVFEKLSVRYFPPGAPRAAGQFVAALQEAGDAAEEALLAYTMLLWNDAVVFLIGQEWLSPRLRQGAFPAETADLERELERLGERVPEVRAWTVGTRRKVACHYLGLLRDCGFAEGTLHKRLRRPYVPPAVVLFGARLLLGAGVAAARVPEDPLFRALGLAVSEVVERLESLRAEGRIDFVLQGGVARLAL